MILMNKLAIVAHRSAVLLLARRVLHGEVGIELKIDFRRHTPMETMNVIEPTYRSRWHFPVRGVVIPLTGGPCPFFLRKGTQMLNRSQVALHHRWEGGAATPMAGFHPTGHRDATRCRSLSWGG